MAEVKNELGAKMNNNLEKLEQLKSVLSKHLASETTDYDLVLELSHKIASLEKDKVRFSIDAGVIDRLGQELVARQETAVSELVKNTEMDLLKVRNFGKTSLKEVKSKLSAMGLSLGMSVEEYGM